MPDAPPSLDTIRHSTAHLMAQAVARLWPSPPPEFGAGPVVPDGFHYDVRMPRRLTDADLGAVEEEMASIVREALPVERVVMGREEALAFFRDRGQLLKVEIIGSIPEGEEITCYRQGEFTDLCRGPHVSNTRELPLAFKLLHVTGAYWRGDESGQMLQRIHGVGFGDRKALKRHLAFLEEARRRDHRRLGKELGLFHFEDAAPASPFFMPKGAFLYNSLVGFVRGLYRRYGYEEVVTPQILDSDLWRTSGHYDHYRENMYFSRIDGREYAVKPMNCPCHMLMYKRHRYSYRDLPLRYADFGRLHRYERHGAVMGLTRVRTFCQDDAHVFLQPERIQEEIGELMEMFFLCYAHFGFGDVKVSLSTRPPERAGDERSWDAAERALREALEKSGRDHRVREGEGAFYGPKIDVEVADVLGRRLQLGTIQLDFLLPERFDLRYTDSDGKEKRPVVIHRALLGSIERFLGLYIEHTGGAFPFWIAPEQVVVVPVSNDAHMGYAREVLARLEAAGVRARIDGRDESLGYKTRQIQKAKVPFMAVVGDREKGSGGVGLRRYGEKRTESLSLDGALELFAGLAREALPPGPG